MFSKNRTILLYEEKISTLEKENKKLMADNHVLRSSLKEAEQMKNDYEQLMEELKELGAKYQKQLGNIERIHKQYETELGRIRKRDW